MQAAALRIQTQSNSCAEKNALMVRAAIRARLCGARRLLRRASSVAKWVPFSWRQVFFSALPNSASDPGAAGAVRADCLDLNENDSEVISLCEIFFMLLRQHYC
jgi:hypothetical protein